MKFIIEMSGNELEHVLKSGSLELFARDLKPEKTAVRKSSEQTLAQAPVQTEAKEAEKIDVNTQPGVQAPAQVQVTVPTAAKSYSIDELSRAAMTLMDMGKQNELLSVLNNDFGVQSMPQLDKSVYPAFANKLRELGADI